MKAGLVSRRFADCAVIGTTDSQNRELWSFVGHEGHSQSSPIVHNLPERSAENMYKSNKATRGCLIAFLGILLGGIIGQLAVILLDVPPVTTFIAMIFLGPVIMCCISKTAIL